MVALAHLTVIRADLPRWLNWPSGALYIGHSRFALLVGGKPRRLAIPSDSQTFTVIIYSLLLGTHEFSISLTPKENGDYRYECRCRRGAYLKALLNSILIMITLMLSCWLGSVILTSLRVSILDLLSTISSMTAIGSALVPILYRVVLAITSKLGGTIIGGVAFLGCTRRLRHKLCEQRPYFLIAVAE